MDSRILRSLPYRKKLKELIDEGYKKFEILKILPISSSTYTLWVRQDKLIIYEHKNKTNRITPQRLNRIIELLKCGITTEEITTHYGYKPLYVNELCSIRKISIRTMIRLTGIRSSQLKQINLQKIWHEKIINGNTNQEIYDYFFPSFVTKKVDSYYFLKQKMDLEAHFYHEYKDLSTLEIQQRCLLHKNNIFEYLEFPIEEMIKVREEFYKDRNASRSESNKEEELEQDEEEELEQEEQQDYHELPEPALFDADPVPMLETPKVAIDCPTSSALPCANLSKPEEPRHISINLEQADEISKLQELEERICALEMQLQIMLEEGNK